VNSHSKIQDILACFKAKIRMPDNEAKSQMKMTGSDLKVIKKSACTNKLHRQRTNEKHMFLEMNLEQIKLLMVQNKNDQEKQQKA